MMNIISWEKKAKYLEMMLRKIHPLYAKVGVRVRLEDGLKQLKEDIILASSPDKGWWFNLIKRMTQDSINEQIFSRARIFKFLPRLRSHREVYNYLINAIKAGEKL